MSVPTFLVASDKATQVVGGAWALVCGLLLLPFGAALALRVVRRMNEAVLGELGPWHEGFFAVARYFFASACFAATLYGAALLSVHALARSGLIKNPWE